MKTWLITGCSSGIGKGIAKAVLKKGDNVVVSSRNKDKLSDFVEEYPSQTLAVSLEVTDIDSINKVVKEANERFGSIDVLVNNAGLGYKASLEDGNKKDVYDLFETNFFGPVELIKAVLPYMKEKQSGAIINLSAVSAIKSRANSGYFAASKAALEMMSDALLQEVAGFGIKVMIVEPGGFKTNFYDNSKKCSVLKSSDFKDNHEVKINDSYHQFGDPLKAGEIIVDTIEQDIYPRRLILGTDAVSIISGELENRINELNQWIHVSLHSDDR